MGVRLVADTLQNESDILVRLVGEIDLATFDDLRLALRPHVKPKATVVLDLAGVTFLSAAGARLLVEAHENLRSLGGRLLLWRPHPSAERTLRIAYPDKLPIQHGKLPQLS